MLKTTVTHNFQSQELSIVSNMLRISLNLRSLSKMPLLSLDYYRRNHVVHSLSNLEKKNSF
jgi:hypothetical protein